MEVKSRKLSYWMAVGLAVWVSVYLLWAAASWVWYVDIKGYELTMPAGGHGEVMHKIHTYTIVGEDITEAVSCEFDEPLQYLNLIMHHYDSNEEMYAEYLELEEPEDPEEAIWGWSRCIWQPADSWAACDVYVVKPDFVHADMNIDTIGHEVYHGACGDYHD